MADFFARVLDAALPISFDTYWSKIIGKPRIYSLDRDGLMVGTNTTTYGFGFDGAYGGSRARNPTEAAWGTLGTSKPWPVGRLWDGKTLWAGDVRTVIGSASFVVGVGATGGTATPLTLPVGVGRQFLTAAITPDGKHLFFVTAAAGSTYGGATGDQWHIVRWTGTAFVAVSGGTIEAPWYEYKFGPGSTGMSDEAGMVESDLVHVWNVRMSAQQLQLFRIGADGVLRLVKTFEGAEKPTGDGFSNPSLYADKGLCAVVAQNRLTIFTRAVLVDTTVAVAVATPFDGHSLRLVQINNGRFDLALYDPALGDGPAVETLVYAVLFTDAEAPVKREPDRYLRRGWWADAEAGSGLWHVRRQPLGSAARREAIEMVRDALEAHGITGVDVQEAAGFASGVSSLVLNITGFYAGRQFVLDVPL